MLHRLSPEAIANDLSNFISNAREFFDGERESTVQVVAWVKGETQEELQSVFDDTYIVLQKKSSGHIVFPSGSVEWYEKEKWVPNPQGIILAGLREFKEELHKILTIDADNIIDVFPPLPFETESGKKYIQFRLLAVLSPLKVVWLEQKFIQSLETIPTEQQEHNNCYVRSYADIRKHIKNSDRQVKDTFHLSLEYHNIAKWRWRYGA